MSQTKTANLLRPLSRRTFALNLHPHFPHTPSRAPRLLPFRPTSYHSSGPRTTHSPPESPLVRQRLNRPVSPHLGIYKWQITSVLSISTRITGLLLSGAFYAFGAAYLVAPSLGWDLSVASIEGWVAGLPPMVKGVGKAMFAFPFVFHVFNGTRIFFFDMALGMKNTQVKRSGWVVVGLTAVASVALATLT